MSVAGVANADKQGIAGVDKPGVSGVDKPSTLYQVLISHV